MGVQSTLQVASEAGTCYLGTMTNMTGQQVKPLDSDVPADFLVMV